ncbi:MAG: dihydroorotate dehydrogenase electron transfer subunit [Gemmataceae bacterium]
MKSSEGPVARVHHKGVDVIANVLIARKTHRITLECPEIAEAIRPGQFVMIRLPNQTDPLLGRPYALYDTVVDEPGKPYAIEIVYLVVGKQTHLLTTLGENDKVEIWCPLGNGFDDVPTLGHVALVAGGIGQTPFLAYIKDLLGIRGYGGESARKKAGRVSLFYGARKAEFLAGVEDFEEAGASVHVATDDGSRGHHGLVTQLLEEHLQSGDVSGIVGCGPEPMLQA